jgi:hypothetical protein
MLAALAPEGAKRRKRRRSRRGGEGGKAGEKSAADENATTDFAALPENDAA